MDTTQFEKYNDIPKESFEMTTDSDYLHDKKLDTKPVGYLKDAFRRFSKNKGSVVAAVIILLLVLYAIIGPFCFHQSYQDAYETDNLLKKYKELLPRITIFDGTGFWDGTKEEEVSAGRLAILKGQSIETGYETIQKIVSEETTTDVFGKTSTLYTIRRNTYYSIPVFLETLDYESYKKLQDWQDETGKQVILPRVNGEKSRIYQVGSQFSVWYTCDEKGNPTLDINGNLIPAYYTTQDEGDRDHYTSKVRVAGDPGIEDPTSEKRYQYAQRTGTEGQYNYIVRINPYAYFEYRYGFEPAFAFGTDSNGYDIFTRLAKGARFSLLLALFVSVVNLTIGAIYGAIEGYYGGVIDMTMERISDILANIPFMVVTVLFQLHLSAKVGIVGALIFAFLVTGWIGMASRVRMQFYRFKNQEYVLAARTLGASDGRIIWKHIFPNSLGTLITGSVLVIPGVIFSETSLSYLGIISLDSQTMSSVGAMLSAGQSVMTSAPHVVLFPALFIALLMISFNLFGNGLRDAFNPSLRGSEG